MYTMDNITKADYDEENDDLFLFSESEVSGASDYIHSIDFDGTIVDFGNKNNIRAVEIMGASKRFKVSKETISKNQHLFAVAYMVDVEGNNTLNVTVENVGGVQIVWSKEDE